MNTKKEFKRIMNEQTEIALATSFDGISNVRIVNFIYNEEEKVLLFASFKDNNKVRELEKNNKVSFTTIPHNGNEHIKAKGEVQMSKYSIFDKKEQFISKIPDYEEMIEQAGQFLILYELSFQEAIVTLDFKNIDTLQLEAQ